MIEPQLDDVGRPEPPSAGGEFATLLGFLDYQRATLEWKTRGLDDAQLRRPLAPSTMTLAGLLEHLARVEDGWFAHTVAERGLPEPWASHDHHWPWSDALTRSGAELRALWASRVAASNVLVGRLVAADADALDRTHPRGTGAVSLRWVLVHMIEEYARHNGHADLLREAIDGATGE